MLMQDLLLLQVTIREDGTRGLAKGWAPTFYGYSMQVCEYVANLSKSMRFFADIQWKYNYTHIPFEHVIGLAVYHLIQV